MIHLPLPHKRNNTLICITYKSAVHIKYLWHHMMGLLKVIFTGIKVPKRRGLLCLKIINSYFTTKF